MQALLHAMESTGAAAVPSPMVFLLGQKTIFISSVTARVIPASVAVIAKPVCLRFGKRDFVFSMLAPRTVSAGFSLFGVVYHHAFTWHSWLMPMPHGKAIF